MGGNIEIENPRQSGAEPVADLRCAPRRCEACKVPPDSVPLAIDEFPVLFIAAACAHGRDAWSPGAEELRVKESDRIAAMSAGFDGAGRRARGAARRHAHRRVAADGPAFGGGEVDSFGDHRIAMSFSIASLRAAGAISIRDVANVATSFPGFVALARSVGLAIARVGV